MSTPTDLNLDALAAEVLTQRGQMKELQGQILKHQIIGATRLDVIRLLGFMMNRDPAPDPMIIAPKEPEVRKIVAAELIDLAKHLRERAVEMEKAAFKLNEDADEAMKPEGDQESS